MLKNDGGPAFPVTLEQLECSATGMSKRELMATLLMAGVVGDPSQDRYLDDYADAAVKAADALLDRLAKDE